MSNTVNPNFEDLRKLPEVAWLWDVTRGRVVWANSAGVGYFGCESLFDLIDRPFDLGESGVERVKALSETLREGQVEAAELEFPSSGNIEAVSCHCMIHKLADGREGLLVIGMPTASTAPEIAAEKLDRAFELLPQAAAFLGQDGSLHRFNAAAAALFNPATCNSLGVLVGSTALSGDLLARISLSATVSDIRRIDTNIGPREMRLTLRRLGTDADAISYAMLLLDDITERRALERQYSGATAEAGTPARMAMDEAAAFQQLGKILASDHVAAARRKPISIPLAVTTAIDRIADAVLIIQKQQLLYANPKALAFFGFATVEDLINDGQIWTLFTGLQQSLPMTALKLRNGKEINFAAQLSTVAWQGGPAQQFTVHAAEALPPANKTIEKQAAKPPTVETKLAAPPPPPEPEVLPRFEDIRSARPAGWDVSAIANDELRAILDTATDGIITLDRHGNIHSFSAGAEAILGYRIAEVVDKPFSDLLETESRKILRDYLAALQGPGLASVFNDGREVNAVVKQGGTVPLFLTIGSLQTKNSAAAFCAVVRDITQWKRTEAELRVAKEAAEETSRQKSDFLARISHELRTPLNAIMGFSEVMRLERFGEIKNDKYRGYVNDIHASGGLLLSLINDLLDLSKVEAGQLELNFTAVNLNDTTDYALRMLQEAATGARVVIRKSIPIDLPNVVADQRSMRQIMLNVLSNAIKFTDPGGQVIVSGLMNKSGELKFRIKDTGIGMNAEQLKDALEPFKRVTTAGREAQGTGLGLPLTRALAEANRATFNISSEPRKGTMIELTFPTTRVLAE